MALFELGRLLATPAALKFCGEHRIDMLELVQRHLKGDWGHVSGYDKARNREAVGNGARIFSSYHFEKGRVWIITAATDDNGERDHTTVMLPSDY